MDTERPKRTVEEILEDFASRVPPDEWGKLPEDFIENLDHYLYEAEFPLESDDELP